VVEHIEGVEVAPSLLNGVGVHPLVGRLFQDSDGLQVALISSGLWKRLGSDVGLPGKSISLNGRAYVITGVLPPWFQLPIVTVANENPHSDVWIPINTPTDEGSLRGKAIYAAYARLKPGVTVAEAQADAKDVAAAIAKANGRGTSYTAKLFGLPDFVVKTFGRSYYYSWERPDSCYWSPARMSAVFC
jgi:hypothetical protein